MLTSVVSPVAGWSRFFFVLLTVFSKLTKACAHVCFNNYFLALISLWCTFVAFIRLCFVLLRGVVAERLAPQP